MKSLFSLFLAALFAVGTARANEGPAVTIVTGAEAPELERLAAAELSGLLRNLFDARVTLSADPTAGANGPRILLGSPATNPAVKNAFPATTDEQSHVVKSTLSGLVIAGGSPVATLWAVYEFGYANGMRYLIRGDFPPVEKPKFSIDGYNIVLQPRHPVRSWRLAVTGPASQASWASTDFEKLFSQLAKLKFNAILLPESDAPIHFAPISVTGDTAGRAVFGGAKEFINPELTGKPGAAEQWIAGISERARPFGLKLETSGASLPALPLGQPRGGLLPGIPPLILPEAAGFAVEASIVGDINPPLHYLSRAAWDTSVTAGSALGDLATPICGEGVVEALENGFAAVSEISTLIAKEDPDFARPDPKMFMKHYESSDPAPEWWSKGKELYGKAMGEMYRANTRARDGARPFILYHAKRYTFALHYLTAIESARKAGIARAAEDEDGRIENLELAIEAMHNALAIYSEVAADQSDRGAIALLNEYAYRPLLKALDE